ncbi:MAG TPA: acyltransferase family protein [Burkholderiaceae bacterium]
MSDYIGLVGGALCALLALITVSVLGPRLGLRLAPGRSAPIDGLRGYAAFFVFICHSAAWFYYVRTGRWAIMPVRAYGNLGSVSVVVFFMITAFLFTSKLLNARQGHIDWLRMLLSRVMRLTQYCSLR